MYWYIVHEWGEAMGEVLDVEFVGRIDLWSLRHRFRVPRKSNAYYLARIDVDARAGIESTTFEK